MNIKNRFKCVKTGVCWITSQSYPNRSICLDLTKSEYLELRKKHNVIALGDFNCYEMVDKADGHTKGYKAFMGNLEKASTFFDKSEYYVGFNELTDENGETYYCLCNNILENVVSFGFLLKMSKQDYDKYTNDEHYKHISKEEFDELIEKYI